MTDSCLIEIPVNKIENRITFKVRTVYYLEFLTPEPIKLVQSTEKKIIKDKNGENMLHLEITKGALVHNDYQNNLIDLFQVSYLVSYLMFLLIFFYF